MLAFVRKYPKSVAGLAGLVVGVVAGFYVSNKLNAPAAPVEV